MPVARSSSQVHSRLPHELFTCSHPHYTDVTRPCKSDKTEQREQQKRVSQLLDRNGRVHVLQLGHEKIHYPVNFQKLTPSIQTRILLQCHSSRAHASSPAQESSTTTDW